MGALLLGLCLSPSLTGELSAQAEKATAPAKEARSSAKEARSALVAAGKLTKTPKGSSKKAKLAAKARAVEAYSAVEARFATQPPIVAEARFRKGQVLGRMGEEEQALRAYQGAVAADAGGFGARAWLESGHLERRLKRYSEALAFYRQSAAMAEKKELRKDPDKPGTLAPVMPSAGNLRYGSQARLWIGVVLSSLGRVPDARECWSKLAAEPAQDARLRIKAFDRLALSYLASKKESEAKKVLADADESLAAACEGKSRKAQSLRRSLTRMRSRRALAKAQTARQAKRGEQGIR